MAKSKINRLVIKCPYPYTQRGGKVYLNGKELNVIGWEIKAVEDSQGVPIIRAKLEFYCALFLEAELHKETPVGGLQQA